MDTHEKNMIILNEAISYLKENANPDKYNHYLNIPRVQSLNEAFEISVQSIGDVTVLGGVIKYNDNISQIRKLVFDFDFKKVLQQYGNGKDDKYLNLYKKFRRTIPSNGKDGKTNSWDKFARNICGAADYISQFQAIDDMFSFFENPQTADERIKLVYNIVDKNIPLWKFKMVCNWLKDIGAIGFSKPDSVLTYVFSKLNLSDGSLESVFRAVSAMAEDNGVPVYIVDKIFWLIGNSNADVIKEIERKPNKNKEDFVKQVIMKYNLS